MDILTNAALMTGLFSAIATGLLFMMASNRVPKVLNDEIAERVERSIAAIDACEDRRAR